MITLEKFREDLARVMAQSKLTQMDVATQCDVPQATISLFLKGNRGLSAVSMLKLWPLVYSTPAPLSHRQDAEN